MLSVFRIMATAYAKGTEIRIGDYPYAAWNNHEIEPGTPRRWYQAPTTFAIILIPESYSQSRRVFAFLHELGHVIDWMMDEKFHSTFDNEVSAWHQAYLFLTVPIIANLDPDRKEFKCYCMECLATYNKDYKYDLAAAWKKITAE